MSSFPEPLTVILAAAGLLVIMTVLSLLHKKKFTDVEKKLFFALIAIPVLLATLYTAGFTGYEHVTSQTGGPVHWHADYQVHVCGERLDLVDPDFPKNKVGSPLFHEHDDDRLHVEGTVMSLTDIDLGSYFYTIGGSLTSDSLVYPTGEEIVEVKNGAMCDGQPGELAVYVNGERISEPADYLYHPDAYVPPGDCIIVKFGPDVNETTDKICESWKAAGWTYDNYEDKRENRPDWVPEYPAHETHEHEHGEDSNGH